MGFCFHISNCRHWLTKPPFSLVCCCFFKINSNFSILSFNLLDLPPPSSYLCNEELRKAMYPRSQAPRKQVRKLNKQTVELGR